MLKLPDTPPAAYGLMADLILLLHIGVVGFVVLGQLLFVAGGLARWHWVRNAWVRMPHLLLMGYVMLQSWLGIVCPLTLWEQTLRQLAGQQSYGESFIEHWLSRLIFFHAPWWVFVAIYTAFATLVLLTWWWIPPRWPRAIQGKKPRQPTGFKA